MKLILNIYALMIGRVGTVMYFQPNSENGETGYNITASGTVTGIDVIYRTLKINTGRTNEKGAVEDVTCLI